MTSTWFNRQAVQDIPLSLFDMSDPALYPNNLHWPLFERLRAEDPVHYCPESRNGPYWSITRYDDILEVDRNHKAFSSIHATTLEMATITGINDDSVQTGGFIMMDPPSHDEQRKIFSPALAPANLLNFEGLIRNRARATLAALPVGEEFDWVERVSVELTSMMLATLFGYPIEDRGRLKFWSDIVAGIPGDGVVDSWEQRDDELNKMAAEFIRVREQRRAAPPATDLISILAHSPLGATLSGMQFVSNMTLLVVGGNDTTRNTMSGGVLALHHFSEEWAKLKANPALVDSLVPETIRFQTPVMYQGRVATQDYDLGGKTIRKGDKVAMWYVSGNRDPAVIDDPERFIVDRRNPRQHLSFGFGIHRCLGNRLAELQLRILWEEILKLGWDRIEVVGEPEYAYSSVFRAINAMPVRIHA
jgi:cytochrome P450